ncbi:hypothetical protein ZWY2020_051391 [Hordeum vulgare]|nr:hypothetical protein ZWY2020_051391 [Hordeum vulgare]
MSHPELAMPSPRRRVWDWEASGRRSGILVVVSRLKAARSAEGHDGDDEESAAAPRMAMGMRIAEVKVPHAYYKKGEGTLDVSSSEKTDLELDKVRAEVMEMAAKMKADRESFRVEAEQMLDSLTAMKERMRKMVEEENATAKDLIEYVQLILPQRSSISILRASACVSPSAPAPVDSENNARNRPDHACPADAVKRRRRRRS